MLIAAARVGYIPVGGLSGAVKVGVWLIFIILLLNALLNLAPGISMEDLVFSPLRFALAYRLAIEA